MSKNIQETEKLIKGLNEVQNAVIDILNNLEEKDENNSITESLQLVQGKINNIVEENKIYKLSEIKALQKKLENIFKDSNYHIQSKIICRNFEFLPEKIQDLVRIISDNPSRKGEYETFLMQLSEKVEELAPDAISTMYLKICLKLFPNKKEKWDQDYFKDLEKQLIEEKSL
jgi:hypothetical protein